MVLPLQIRLNDGPTRLTASAVPYGVAVKNVLEFAFIHEHADGTMEALSPHEFARGCRSAACAPHKGGGSLPTRGVVPGSPSGGVTSQGIEINVSTGTKKAGPRSPEVADMTPEAKVAALKVINSIAGMEDVKTVEEAVTRVERRLMATVDIAMGYNLPHGADEGKTATGPYDAARIQATSQWYDVANVYVGKVAAEHGFNHSETAAAVFATLSPGAPWPSNVRNGEQVMKFVAENKVVGADGSKDLVYRSGRILEGKRDALKKAGESLDDIDAQIAENNSPANLARVTKLYGDKKFNDLDENTASMLIQGNTQRNELKEIDLVPQPDGTYTVGASKSKAIIQSVANTSKAIRMARADKAGATAEQMVDVISDGVSKGSKARAFYMNIAHPRDTTQNAVTLDTHAYGALTGVPLSLKTSNRFFAQGKEVGFANSYPIMREAMARVGVELQRRGMSAEVMNRGVQSVVWEMERAILPEKGKSAVLKGGDGPGSVTAQAAALYREGRDLEAKTLIARAAGGIE